MMNRREALTRIGGFMAAGWLTGQAGAKTVTGGGETTSTIVSATPGKDFTFAHITDIHLFSLHHAQSWFRKCLHDVQSHPLKPAMLINTGDCVFDSLKADRARADELWGFWHKAIKDENSMPIKHCLGNHDHWGLKLPDNDPARKDPMFGKKMGLASLGLDRGYYSFDHGDWHFIMLDSIFPEVDQEKGWTAKLDHDQYKWLKADLKATNKPVAVYSHVPILSIATMIHQKPSKKDGCYRLTPHGVMGDARKIIDLFAKHPNVKLCLSGHLHLQDYIEMSGVTYICDGSVCGQWWRGDHLNCPPGYSMTTYKPDGTFEHKYSTYGWHGDEGDVKA